MMFHNTSQNATHDFAQYAKKRLVIFDKTSFIKEALDESVLIRVFLYPPSGKSFNLSMLRYFLDKNNSHSSNLFEGMEISKYHDFIASHQNKYSVVYLNFSGLKARNEEEVRQILFEKMCKLCQEYKETIHSLPKPSFANTLENLVNNKEIQTINLSKSLGLLLECIQKDNYMNQAPRYYEKPFIIIDSFDSIIDYDTSHFSDKGVLLLQSFFSRALKDNSAFHLAVIADASNKHHLLPNNCNYYGHKDSPFNKAFGLTLEEVKDAFNFYQIPQSFIKLNPDFYRIKLHKKIFCEEAVFNPQQVFELVSKHLADQARIPKETYRPSHHNLFFQPPVLIVENTDDNKKMQCRK